MALKKYTNGSWVDIPYKRYETGTEAVTSLPVTLYTDGQPVSSYTLKGNTTTSGTPSPQNPITINGVGNKTANLFDKNAQAGQIYVTDSVQRYGVEIPLSAGQYVISGGSAMLYVKTKIGTTYGGASATSSPVSRTLSQDGYILIYAESATIYNDSITELMLNSGSTALPYEPYGYKISISSNQAALSPIYLSQPLRKSLDGTAFDTLDSTGLVTYNVDEYGQPQTATTETVTVPTITTTGGEVSIDVDTTVKPSEMSLTYHGWHSHEPLKRENGSWS